MKFINVIYDYEYDDVNNEITNIGPADILNVPDFVCENLDIIAQKFFTWIEENVRNAEKNKYPDYWTQLPNGEMCIGCNSEHFVKWINLNYFQCEKQESALIKIETKYNPDYPSAKL